MPHAAPSKTPKPLPNPAQLAALQRYANGHGRTWKSQLSQAWSLGRDECEPDGALLRQVRNVFGPGWLLSKANPVKPAA